MGSKTGQPTQTLSRADLERLGFTREQVSRLMALRERYHPLIEEVESNRQWRQLQLLRWLYRQGRYPRG